MQTQQQLERELTKTEAKLKELRIKWRDGSPAYKKMVEQMAKIHTENKNRLSKLLDQF